MSPVSCPMTATTMITAGMATHQIQVTETDYVPISRER
jgi:hypothetical protein